MFVLRLFGKLMPFSPTLKGCCRFHPTQKVGPWTLLTSNPSNTLSAVLKTGENGGWLTVVACWHMWYLLKQISWQWHDWASKLCVHKLIHSELHSIWLCWCTVRRAFLASLSITITHVEHSCTYNLQLNYTHCPSCQPSFCTSSLKPPPILQHFRVHVVHVIMTCAYTFTCCIVIDMGTELLDWALTFTAEWTVWWVSFFLILV